MKPTSSAERTLISGGYAVAIMLLVVPIADSILATWPPAPSSIQWRFGMLGLLGNSLSYPVLAMLMAALTARFLEQRRVLATLGVLGALAAVFLLVGVGFFALDTLQLRSVVRPTMQRPFLAAAVKSGTIFVVAAAIFAWLSLGAYRAARASKDFAKADARKAADHKLLMRSVPATARPPG